MTHYMYPYSHRLSITCFYNFTRLAKFRISLLNISSLEFIARYNFRNAWNYISYSLTTLQGNNRRYQCKNF